MADLIGFMPEETGAEQVRVETFFKPNLDLIASALGARQQRYNTNLETMSKVKAKVDEVNSLEGFDREEWFKMQEEYDKQINQIMSLYEGDLSKASGELNVFTSKVGKDFGVHGKATAINERALGYMANKKELDKRLQERKITEGQYFKLQQELEATKSIGIGSDAKAYRGWRKINPMDAIDFDEFAQKFLQNFNADYSEGNGWVKRRDDSGLLIWEKVGHESIKYDDVLKDLSLAYKNAADKTGQLRDDFDYHIYRNKISMTGEEYVKKYTDLSTAADNELKLLSIEKPNETQAKEIQNLVNRYASKKVQVDGILGTEESEYIKLLKPMMQEKKDLNFKTAEQIKIMNNDQLRQYYYGDYLQTELTRMADPYADKTAYDKIKIDMQIREDPYLEHALAMERDRAKVDYERAVANTTPYLNSAEAISMMGVEEIKDLNKALTGLENEKKEINAKYEEARKNKNVNLEATLKRQLDGLDSKIRNINQAMFEIDSKMGQQGLKTNSTLIDEKLKFYLSGFGGDWWFDNDKRLTNYNTFHTALISGMTPDERRKRFGTDDIVKIKNKYKGNENEIKKLNQEISQYYKQNPNQLTIANKWVKDNFTDKTVRDFGAKDDMEELVRQVTNNTKQYVEKSNDNIFVQSANVFTTSNKDSPLGKLQQELEVQFKSNPQGFLDITGKQAVLGNKGETFYDAKGQPITTPFDLTQIKADQIAIAQTSINGEIYFKVPLLTSEGKPMYRKRKDGTYEQATTFVTTANAHSRDSALTRVALENINMIKTLATTQLSEYTKKGELNRLTEGEFETRFGTYNDNYLDQITNLASINYLGTLQRQGVNKIPLGGAKEMNIDGSDVLVVRGVPKFDNNGNFTGYHEIEQWSVYKQDNYYYDKNNKKYVPKQGGEQNLYIPNLYTSLTNFQKGNSKNAFENATELSKALEFNLRKH